MGKLGARSSWSSLGPAWVSCPARNLVRENETEHGEQVKKWAPDSAMVHSCAQTQWIEPQADRLLETVGLTTKNRVTDLFAVTWLVVAHEHGVAA